MDALVGDHRLAVRVDRDHRLLPNSTFGLAMSPITESDLVRAAPPEHHVELREPEDEGVALVDQRDLNVVPELVGQPGRQLEAAEPGPEDQNP